MLYKVKGYRKYRTLPENHRHLLEEKVIFVDSTENVIAPDHKYSFINEDTFYTSSSIKDFFDINRKFVFRPDKRFHPGFLFEFWIPRGWCIKGLQFDDSKLDYFHLYSEMGEKAFLRYNFYLNKISKISISGLLMKDVNNMFDRLVIAELDPKKRNKILNETIAPKQMAVNSSLNKPAKFSSKRDEVRKRYGSLLTDIINGKIRSEQDFIVKLRKILNNPSYQLPKKSKSLFDHNGDPIQKKICEILSQSYTGENKTISADTFRDIYRDKRCEK